MRKDDLRHYFIYSFYFYVGTQSPDPRIKVKTISEIRTDQINIEVLVSKCFFDYLGKARQKPIENPYANLMGDAANLVIYGLTGSKIYVEILSESSGEKRKLAQELADDFISDWKSGKVEQKTQVPSPPLKKREEP